MLLEFGESKKLIRIPNCDVDEALLDTLEGHLKRVDVIDYGAQSR